MYCRVWIKQPREGGIFIVSENGLGEAQAPALKKTVSELRRSHFVITAGYGYFAVLISFSVLNNVLC